MVVTQSNHIITTELYDSLARTLPRELGSFHFLSRENWENWARIPFLSHQVQ
jgi:hypothetical protein